MNRPKVYVVHEPLRRDHDSGTMRPMHDLTPATQFGDIRFILPRGVRPDSLDPEAILPDIREAMSGYTSDDFIVAVGDMTIVAWATALACRATGGIVNLLRWDARHQIYYSSSAMLWDNDR